ncbi:hypothetical protein FRC03_004572 [Tulasnella sp. 419]|nr:hypothetical protein FRC03_004572 [Tulasnella sp. 419]
MDWIIFKLARAGTHHPFILFMCLGPMQHAPYPIVQGHPRCCLGRIYQTYACGSEESFARLQRRDEEDPTAPLALLATIPTSSCSKANPARRALQLHLAISVSSIARSPASSWPPPNVYTSFPEVVPCH